MLPVARKQETEQKKWRKLEKSMRPKNTPKWHPTSSQKVVIFGKIWPVILFLIFISWQTRRAENLSLLQYVNWCQGRISITTAEIGLNLREIYLSNRHKWLKGRILSFRFHNKFVECLHRSSEVSICDVIGNYFGVAVFFRSDTVADIYLVS